MSTIDSPGDSRPGGAAWRRKTEFLLPAAAVAIAVLAPLVVWDRLPEPMAAHWNASGVPDGALAKSIDLLGLAFATALVGFGSLLAARARMAQGMAQVLVAAAWGGSTLLAALRIATVRANLDAERWDLAGSLPGPALLLVLPLAMAAAAVGVWLAADRPDHQPTTRSVGIVELQPGEAGVWTGRATGKLGWIVPAVFVVGVAVAAWIVPAEVRTWVLVVAPLVAVLLSLMGQVRVVVDARGLTVWLGWLGWPSWHVPVEQITRVQVENVDPMAYGGWGLRLVPSATAVVVRRGDAIRVDRADKTSLVVTIDDAARGASVLLAHHKAQSD